MHITLESDYAIRIVQILACANNRMDAKTIAKGVLGLGGIMNAADAIEFMMAGATAIEIGTANFIDPTVTMQVIDGINEWLDAHGVKDIHEIIGVVD